MKTEHKWKSRMSHYVTFAWLYEACIHYMYKPPVPQSDTECVVLQTGLTLRRFPAFTHGGYKVDRRRYAAYLVVKYEFIHCRCV